MSKYIHLNDKKKVEVSILNVVTIILDGKKILFISTFSFLILGLLYLIQPPRISADIYYRPYVLPPLYEIDDVIKDYQNIFFSNETHKEWKNNNNSANFPYESLTDKSSFVFKRKEERFKLYYIDVTSKIELEHVLNYAQFANTKLTQDYLHQQQKILNSSKVRLKKQEDIGYILRKNIRNSQEFENELLHQKSIIYFRTPDKIEYLPNTNYTLSLFTLIGLSIGVIIQLFKHKAKM